MTLRRLFLLLLLPAFFSCRCGERAPRGESLTILLTHEMAGLLAAVECEKCEAGGLARRVAALGAAREETDGASLLIEGGDFLTSDLPRDRQDAARRLARAELIADVYRDLRYDAVLFGPRDYALGLPVLRDLAARMNVAALGANVRDTQTAAAAWPESLVLKAGKLTVGLFGLTDRLPPGCGARADDPLETAARVTAQLRPQVDLVILAANLDHRMLQKVLEQTPGIDLTLRSGAGRRLHKPATNMSDTPVISLRYGDRQLGRLAVTLAEPGEPLIDRTESLALERKIELYRNWMAQQEEQAGGKKKVEAHLANDAKTLQRYRRYRETVTEWSEALKQMRGAGNFFDLRTVRLDADTPVDGATSERLAAFFEKYGPDVSPTAPAVREILP